MFSAHYHCVIWHGMHRQMNRSRGTGVWHSSCRQPCLDSSCTGCACTTGVVHFKYGIHECCIQRRNAHFSLRHAAHQHCLPIAIHAMYACLRCMAQTKICCTASGEFCSEVQGIRGAAHTKAACNAGFEFKLRCFKCPGLRQDVKASPAEVHCQQLQDMA